MNSNFIKKSFILSYLILFIHNTHSFVISSNKSLESKINNYFKDELVTKKDIEEYLIQNNYFKSKILESKSNYIILNPIQSLFIIKNNYFLNDYKIQKIIKNNEINSISNLTQNLLSSIKLAYQKEGFQDVKITQTIKRDFFKEWVHIIIDEGLRSRIEKVTVTGLLSKPSEFYSQFILNNSSPLIKEGYFNRKDLEKGYKNLTEYLKRKGYLSSKIYSDRVIQKKHLFYITVNLEEGSMTLIKSVTFNGNKSIRSERIISEMKLKTQSPFERKILNDDLERIKEFYHSNGYLFMDFDFSKNVITYDENYKYAIINLKIDEGIKTKVSKITIEGHKKSQEDSIKKSLKFKIGDTLTPKKISQSVTSLNSLGVFKRINIDYDNKKNTTVTLNLQEAKPRSLRGGAGITTERRFSARSYLEYTHKNFFGYGRAIFGRADGQSTLLDKNPILEYKLSGNYQEIFFIEQQIKGNVGLSRSRNIFNYSNDNTNIIEISQANVSINKVFEPYLKIDMNLWNLEYRRESCVIGFCPENLQKIGKTGMNITYDKRDNVFKPKKGFLLSASGEYATPKLGSSSNIEFRKIQFQSQFYLSFLNNYTLAIALKSGVISSFDSIPVGRAFLLGGQTSVRGYDGYIEGERIPNSDKVPIKTANEILKLKINDVLQKVTDTQFGLFKIELRFPLFKNITSLIFYDFGTVNLKTTSQNFLQYGHSIGLGFRYETFIIPVGLDIGYKLNPKFGSDYKFHLSIGLF